MLKKLISNLGTWEASRRWPRDLRAGGLALG